MTKRLVQPGTSRIAGCRVLVDGKALPGAAQVEVTSNAHYQADKHRITLALNAPNGQDLDWWGADERKGALFDVRITLDGDEQSFIIGEADQISIHPAKGLVEIEGRDLTARLIDNKVQQAFQNQTASEIVTTLAQRRGLTPVVTSTTTPVSRYYKQDHDRVSHDQFSHSSTEWDLITYLAQNEGFDAYVTGKELHFEKAVDPNNTDPYVVKWNQDKRISDAENLRLERSLTLAKDVVVVVRSWHSAKGHGFSKASPQGSSTAAVYAGKAQRYVYVRPNLTEDQAQQLANSLRDDITKHERKISFDCPGEMKLTPRDIILLSGAGGWNQKYFVNTVTRRVSSEGGFMQAVTAKNKNVESQSTLS